MKGVYRTEWVVKAKSSVAALATAAILGQVLAFGVSAQSIKGKGTLAQQEERTALPVRAQNPDKKIAPDMLEAVENQSRRNTGDPIVKVIVRTQSATNLNQMAGNATPAQAAQLFAVEAKAAKTKMAGLRETLTGMRGNLKRTFSNLGLASAELPLSKVKELAASGDVEYISPDRNIESFGHLNQTLGMYNSGVYVKSGYDYRDATGIGIAVIDSGMYSQHELFKKGGYGNRIVANVDFTGQNRTDDPYGHGTHVASLAAGDWYMSNGAYESPASEANIINLRALKHDGSGTSSSVIAALDWAIANKAAYNIRVINMSLGTQAFESYRNDPLCLAARRAFNAGIVVVASAGNLGKDEHGNKVYGSVNSPGIEPTVLTVGAADTKGTDYRSDDKVASYSSKGPGRGFEVVDGVRVYDNNMKPDVIAPGNKLLGARAPSNNLLLSNPLLAVGSILTPDNKKVMYLSGTSMAAPVASSAAAVLIDTNPNLTPNMVKAILMYTAQAKSDLNALEQGAGEINLDGAVRIAKLVKSTLPTQNGDALLTAPLPNPQRSSIDGQYVYWTKAVVTNRLLLTGDDLMIKYQGMYANGLIMGDSVEVVDHLLTRSGDLTSGLLEMGKGVVMGDGAPGGDGGVVMGDGITMGGEEDGTIGFNIIFLNGIVMGSGWIFGDSVGVGDGGVVMGDGVCFGDGIAMGDSWAQNAMSGDDTGAMTDEEGIPQR